MKNNKSTFVFSLLLALIALTMVIVNWGGPEKWRFQLALAGFAIFFIMACASAYVTFFRKY